MRKTISFNIFFLGMMLLHDLKGTMQLDHSKDVFVHVSTSHQL